MIALFIEYMAKVFVVLLHSMRLRGLFPDSQSPREMPSSVGSVHHVEAFRKHHVMYRNHRGLGALFGRLFTYMSLYQILIAQRCQDPDMSKFAIPVPNCQN